MSAATSTIITIGALAAKTGADIYASKKQADANKTATKTESESADKALAQLKEQYDLERADNAPYRQIGTGALANLGYLSGIDMTPTADPRAAAVQVRQSVEDTARATRDANSPISPGQRAALEKLGHSGGWVSGPARKALGQIDARAANPQTNPGGMVRVKSPTGQIGVIPASMLTKALQAGATQVN